MYPNCANDGDGGGDGRKHESIEMSKELSQPPNLQSNTPTNTDTSNKQQVCTICKCID